MSVLVFLIGRMGYDGVLCLFVVETWMSVDMERHCKDNKYSED